MALDIKKFFQGLKLLNKTSPSNGVSLQVDDSYNVNMTLEFPSTGGTTGQEVVTTDATQTLTNKTIDSADNTVVIDAGDLTPVPGEANRFLSRDGSGEVVSTIVTPTGNVVGTSDTQTLTNKTIDADSNTITNIENADIKAGAAIDASKIADGSVSSAEFQYLDGVTSAIQTQIDGKVAKAGDTMTGALTLNADPTSALHAATKQYVDSISAGLDPKEAVRVATTTSLGGSYATTPSNGRFTGAATSVDGVSLTSGNRVLVKDQADPKENGIYTYDGGGQYTRSSDMDGSPAAEVSSGNYSFATEGSTNAAKGFVLTGDGVLTLNVDNITWTQFSGASNAALRDLSNLTTTAINADLLPDTDISISLGSTAKRWLNAFISLIKDSSSSDSIDIENRRLKSGSTIKLNWAGTDVSLNTRKLTDVVDPTSDQDAATKAYVDNNVLQNFITNGRGASTTGWAVYADAAGAAPVDGTGGSPASTSITTTTTNPLTGLNSLLLNKTATTNNQGEGWSYNFTIDNASKSKVLKVEFDYILNSGTFVAGDNSTDSTITVWLYDVTNSRLIQPSTYKLYGNSTITAEHFSSTFQTSPDSTSYRLIIHQGTTATPQFVLKIDNVSINPSQYVYGTPISDWISYTPTGSWVSNTTYAGKWRRVGDTAEYQIQVNTSGLPTNTQLSVNLASGHVIDTTKCLQASSTYVLNGRGGIFDTSAGAIFDCAAVTNGSNVVTFRAWSASGSYTQHVDVVQTTPMTWAAGDTMAVGFAVPITGWSSSLQVSDSADTRVVALAVFNSGSQSVSTGVGIPTPAISQDTHGSFNTSNNTYTVPVQGNYMFFCSGAGTTAPNGIDIFVNGSGIKRLILFATANQTTSGAEYIAGLNAGDVITFRATGSYTLSFVNLSAIRVSGPSAIAATETVVASYIRNASQSIPNNTNTDIIWDLKDVDTHNAMNTSTGVYTVPVSGNYRVSSTIFYSSFTPTAGDLFRLNLTSTSRTAGYQELVAASTQAMTRSMTSTYIFPCKAGDTLKATTLQVSGSARNLTAALSCISIERVK